MPKARAHPLKGQFRSVGTVVVEHGISGPIRLVQNGKTRIVKLSDQYLKFDDRLIMAMLGPDRNLELSEKALRLCESCRCGDVGWKPISIALKQGKPMVKIEFGDVHTGKIIFQKTIGLRKKDRFRL